MKIFLNLLPEDKKNEIKRSKRYRIIIWQGTILFFITAVFISILLSINLILKIQLESTDQLHSLEQSQGRYRQLQEFENEFKSVSSELSVLSMLQKNSLHWIDLFYQLNSAASEAVVINDMATKNFQVFLAGKSNSRDDLLSFQEKINAIECFNDANIPINFLVKKNDVDFQMDLRINEECIRKHK